MGNVGESIVLDQGTALAAAEMENAQAQQTIAYQFTHVGGETRSVGSFEEFQKSGCTGMDGMSEAAQRGLFAFATQEVVVTHETPDEKDHDSQQKHDTAANNRVVDPENDGEKRSLINKQTIAALDGERLIAVAGESDQLHSLSQADHESERRFQRVVSDFTVEADQANLIAETEDHLKKVAEMHQTKHQPEAKRDRNSEKKPGQKKSTINRSRITTTPIKIKNRPLERKETPPKRIAPELNPGHATGEADREQFAKAARDATPQTKQAVVSEPEILSALVTALPEIEMSDLTPDAPNFVENEFEIPAPEVSGDEGLFDRISTYLPDIDLIDFFEQEFQDAAETYDIETAALYQQLLQLQTANENLFLEPLEIEMPEMYAMSIDEIQHEFKEAVGYDHSALISEFKSLFDLEEPHHTPGTYSEITQAANGQDLEQTFLQLATILPEQALSAGEVEQEVKISDLMAVITDVELAIERMFATALETRTPPRITLEITEKLLVLARALGYEKPDEVLIAFLEKYDLIALQQSLVLLRKLHEAGELQRQQRAVTISDDVNENLVRRLGGALMRLVNRPLILADAV